jgi:hypothetical protein
MRRSNAAPEPEETPAVSLMLSGNSERAAGRRGRRWPAAADELPPVPPTLSVVHAGQWQVPLPESVKVLPATDTNFQSYRPADSVSFSTPCPPL